MNWVLYSLLSAVGFGGISLIVTYFTRANISAIVINLWFWSLTTVGFFSWYIIDKSTTFKITKTQFFMFLLLAVVAVVTNYFSVKALEAGPNTGIVRSVQMVQIVVAAAGGIILYNQGITLKGFFGIALIVLGVYLVANK